MSKSLSAAVVAACAAVAVAPAAHADRAEPPPLYGHYDVFIDFSRQTFNGQPTPMAAITVPVELSTRCDADGCVARWDNGDDHARNPGAPLVYEYRWTGDRWATSGEYPYFCDRADPGSAVQATRSDYLIPKPDGGFFGERTLVIGGAGCPGEGPGTHWVPISLTPVDPPLPPAPAAADRAEPVPVYGYYDAFLDHSRQTFNGQPAFADPATQLGLFTTDCGVNGCVVRWLRETAISQDPDAPAQFEYRWNGDRWESAGKYPFYCNPDGSGGTVLTQRSDWLKSTGDGGFVGERRFTVPAPGCPGQGPGAYWLPIALAPVDSPQPR